MPRASNPSLKKLASAPTNSPEAPPKPPEKPSPMAQASVAESAKASGGALGPDEKTFAARLVHWQKSKGRHDFPWSTPDPYKVWISEIMLQQTQAATVLPYFQRFMDALPDLKSLMNAPEDDVLALWSGLGYYSRARNIWKSGQLIKNQMGGVFPASAAQITELPGVGRSTANAIAAFCFGEATPVMDGNAQRGFCRLWGISTPVDSSAGKNELWDLAERLMPETDTAAYTQAVMDFGATLCKPKNPDCPLCPFQAECAAKARGVVNQLPAKGKAKKAKPSRQERWLCLFWGDKALLKKNEAESGVWRGLLIFPGFEAARLAGAPEPAAHDGRSMVIEHEFSHYSLQASVDAMDWSPASADEALELAEALEARWEPVENLARLPLPSPVTKALQKLAPRALAETLARDLSEAGESSAGSQAKKKKAIGSGRAGKKKDGATKKPGRNNAAE